VLVEDVTIASIQSARAGYGSGELRRRLSRHHADPDSAFWGWSDAWLDPAFRDWNIESLVPEIRCPVLVVQGRDDEYGTAAQVERITAAAHAAEPLILAACGHAVHRDRPEELTRATVAFLKRHSRVVPRG
ncbi:MAG: alpha/beta hydrolase, partial [Myxococcales bacterium]|nr:alpha/beta hydrolase [Myxococcales bacterium]